MQAGDWFRSFGHDRYQYYFEMIAYDEMGDTRLRVFEYDALTGRVRTTREEREETRRWLERMAANEVQPITSAQVPFLLAL